MGLFDAFKVVPNLELKRSTFFPGNIVEGCFFANVKSEITIVAVRLKITGKEKVVIRRQEQDGDATITRVYSNTTVVYKQLITLAGQLKCSNNHNKINVPAGQYSYPFAFTLPSTLPPSFFYNMADDHASMQYHIKVYIDIPMGRDSKAKQFITLLNCIPVSQWIQRFPANNRADMPVTFCCCISKGNVLGSVSLDRTLFAIDRDSVTVVCDIDNSRGQNPVNGVNILLRNKQNLRAQGRNESNSRVVGEQKIVQQVAPGARGQLTGTLILPRTIIPSFIGHGVTSVYEITVEFDIPWATDPQMNFPVRCVQSVDETNFFPPLQWDMPLCAQLANMQEYYYQPPQTSPYQCQFIACQPPPGAMMYNYQQPAYAAPIPDTRWNETAVQMCPPIGYAPPRA